MDLNGGRAYERAGYAAKGNAAEAAASRLLSDVKVAARIAELQAERAARVQVTVDDVLRGLHEEATFRGFGSTHGARVSAWGLLGKHLGMFGADGSQRNPHHFDVTWRVVSANPAGEDPDGG